MRLKELRNRANLTQNKLAKEIGVSRSTIAMYESGASEPDIEIVTKLSHFFNVSIDYLLENDKFLQQNLSFTQAQKNLISKVKFLSDDQCITLCSIIETFGNVVNNDMLTDYKILKKYE